MIFCNYFLPYTGFHQDADNNFYFNKIIARDLSFINIKFRLWQVR